MVLFEKHRIRFDKFKRLMPEGYDHYVELKLATVGLELRNPLRRFRGWSSIYRLDMKKSIVSMTKVNFLERDL